MRGFSVFSASCLLFCMLACDAPPTSGPVAEPQLPDNPNEQANLIAGQAITAMGQMQVLSGPAAAGTHDCAGGGVTIRASGVQTTLTGDCATLLIEGADNNVSAERLASVAIRGDRNMVTYLPGRAPVISQVGQNNRVQSR